MERESEYLLHLLGAWLREEAPEVPQDLDWSKVLRLAEIHSLTGILGYMSMSWPICPPDQQKMLRSVCLNTIAAFNRRGIQTTMLLQQLEQAGIEHIVMKGFVLREYYPVPELRTYGDVDLVIHPEDRQRCHALMQKLGFQTDTDWEPVFSYRRVEEYYEIHTHIMEVDVSDKADHREYFEAVWSHVEQKSGMTFQLTPEFHFLYLITHIAKHLVGSGAGLRMYLDLGAFIRHFGDTLDWSFIRRELETLKLWPFANVALTLVQCGFGVESPLALEPVEERTWNTFLSFTLQGGVFGQAGMDSGTNTLKAQSRGGEITRVGAVRKRLFPSAKTIESRYTYLQKKPWLLPVAWVHRLILTRDTWRQHTKEAQGILTANLDAVEQIKALYQQLGL